MSDKTTQMTLNNIAKDIREIASTVKDSETGLSN